MSNCICKNIPNWDGKQIECNDGNNTWLGFELCDNHQNIVNKGEITLHKIIEEAKKDPKSKYYANPTL